MEHTEESSAMMALMQFLDIPRKVEFQEALPGIGPCDPRFFEKYVQSRREAEAEALAKFRKYGENRLWDLLSPTLSQDYFQTFYRLDDMPKWYAGGFNVVGHQPNWSKWQLMDLWSIEETTCISIGFEPEKMPKSGMWSESPSEPMIFFWDRMEQIGRADVFEAKHLNKVSPTRFIQWAVKKKLDIPTEFAEMFDSPTSKSTTGMLKTVDAREHDSALKIILAWMAVEYGFEGGEPPAEMRRDVSEGLKKLRLGIDPKTLKRVLSHAKMSLDRFQKIQEKRDGDSGL